MERPTTPSGKEMISDFKAEGAPSNSGDPFLIFYKCESITLHQCLSPNQSFKTLASNVVRLPRYNELMKLVAFIFNDLYYLHPYEEIIEAAVIYDDAVMRREGSPNYKIS